jgi:Tol biopolymer transport system component
VKLLSGREVNLKPSKFNGRATAGAILLLSYFGLIGCASQTAYGPESQSEPVIAVSAPAITPVPGNIVAATHLRIVASDGSNKADLDLVGQAPRWSPDGREILFAAIQTQPGTLAHQIRQERDYPTSAVVLTNAAGTEVQVLVENTTGITYPDWSPDGRQIVFVSAHLQAGKPSIFLVQRDGSNVRLLMDCSDFAGGCSLPRWSPQGDRIAFFGDGSLQIIDLHTVSQAVVTETMGYSLEWSPSGEELLFAKGNGIFVIQLDSQNLRELFRLEADTQATLYPAWSPNGEQIIVGAIYRNSSTRESSPYGIDPPPYRYEIWLMTREGTDSAIINYKSLIYPHWRPLDS